MSNTFDPYEFCDGPKKQKDGRWVVYWRNPVTGENGKVRRKVRADCAHWIETTFKSMVLGKTGADDSKSFTFRDALDFYLEDALTTGINRREPISEGYAIQMRGVQRLHLEDFAALDYPVDQTNTRICVDLMRHLTTKRTESSAVAGAFIKRATAYAFNQLRCASDPFAPTTAPSRASDKSRQKKTNKVMPERSKILSLFDKSLEMAEAAPKESDGQSWRKLHVAVALGAMAGLRRGEICAFRNCDVNRVEKTITVSQAVKSITNKIGPPKSDAGARTLPVSDKLLGIIDSYIEDYPSQCDLLLHTRNNTHILPRNLARQFESLAEKCDVTHFGLHGLRHYYASLLIESGADLTTLKNRLGHSDVSLTINVYGHLLEAAQKREHIIEI